MNTLEGWIKVHRKIEQWEWYTDANTFRLFFHLVLRANHADKKWQGIIIKRGQLVTSSEHLASQLKLSRQQIRTSLNKLKSTNEITIKSTNKYTVITIANYDVYQMNSDEPTSKTTNNITNEQPSNNHQITTNKNVKNDKNDKNINIADSIQNIINSWNDLNLTQIKTINPNTNRFKLLNTRLREYGESEIIKAINLIKECPFLLGQSQGGWIITFDWFIKPNNFVKVLEGTYKGKNDFKAKNSNQRLNVVDMRDDELKERLRQKMAKG